VLMDSNSPIMLAGMALMMIVMMGGLLISGWTIYRRHRHSLDPHPLSADRPQPPPAVPDHDDERVGGAVRAVHQVGTR
jgi:hypothetical protein